MSSLQGHLLAASPYLLDPNFVRTVVLLVQHTESGAMGVVLNRSVGKTIQELWKEIHEVDCDNTRRVNLGGPVSGPVMAIHTCQALGEMEVVPGVYFAAERGHLEQLVARNDDKFKLFVGHSGWGSGQLESEIQQGAWLTRPASAEYIFHEEDDLWQWVTREIGRSLLTSTLHLKQLPDDPTMN